MKKTLHSIHTRITQTIDKVKGGRSAHLQKEGLVAKATKYLWRHSWLQFLGISTVIAFLLFFLHLFLVSAYVTQQISTDITQRLGFYFYIVEPGQNGNTMKESDIFGRVMNLKTELEQNNLQVEYYSKTDALELLQQRIPGVIQNFDKYGIANPLPATLYVTFDNNAEYEALGTTVANYTDVVRNTESIQTKGGFAEQQERVSNIINITNFSMAFSLVLVFVVCAMIITFLLLIITMKCRQFWKNIEVEKLLGANYMTIKMPFLLSVALMLLIAFVLTSGIVGLIAHYV